MGTLSNEQIKLLDAAVTGSPYGKLLGLRLVESEVDCVRMAMPFREDLTTYGDTFHGGAISALVDTAATASFWANPDVAPGSRGGTVGFSISFTTPARGKDLTASARVRRRGREICTGDVSVTDPDGREIAVALVTYKLSTPAA